MSEWFGVWIEDGDVQAGSWKAENGGWKMCR